MNSPDQASTPAVPLASTPVAWRVGLLVLTGALAATAYLLLDSLSLRVRAGMGVVAFIALAAAFSTNLRAVNWHTIAWGFALQVGIAFLILKFQVGDVRPVYELFDRVGSVINKFLEFTGKGSDFVFGPLADPAAMDKAFGRSFVFAFQALPTIIFVSSFFSILYYFGILQLMVRGMALVMQRLMRTSGAETLSAAANVFMGQTEAPLIVKPYVAGMTRSELLALMIGGMATISGGIMAVFIKLGANPVAILTTSVMAAPCGLYLAKLLLPELDEPETRGGATVAGESTHVNVIDAAASGASDGLTLALNVAAMLIAFLALIAMTDALLGLLSQTLAWLGLGQWDLSLRSIFSTLFAPAAALMGVTPADVPATADLLGTKLVANEFVAYEKLLTGEYRGTVLQERTRNLCVFALTGFANFSSIAIQLGGIGGMAPNRRHDLARLGGRALLGGFLATMVNAALAGVLLE